jgi:hypothetical protein
MVENHSVTDKDAIATKIENGEVKVAGHHSRKKPPNSQPKNNETEAKEKQKTVKSPPPAKPAFPAATHVNAYGFIRLNKDVAEAFGIPKGKKADITIDLKDGKLIISRA